MPWGAPREAPCFSGREARTAAVAPAGSRRSGCCIGPLRSPRRASKRLPGKATVSCKVNAANVPGEFIPFSSGLTTRSILPSHPSIEDRFPVCAQLAVRPDIAAEGDQPGAKFRGELGNRGIAALHGETTMVTSMLWHPSNWACRERNQHSDFWAERTSCQLCDICTYPVGGGRIA